MIGSHPKVAKTCNRDTSLLIVLSKSCVHIQLKCGVLLFDFFLSQIAMFYVAVLAGLLHRFPVSFSQVWICLQFCEYILMSMLHQ